MSLAATFGELFTDGLNCFVECELLHQKISTLQEEVDSKNKEVSRLATNLTQANQENLRLACQLRDHKTSAFSKLDAISTTISLNATIAEQAESLSSQKLSLSIKDESYRRSKLQIDSLRKKLLAAQRQLQQQARDSESAWMLAHSAGDDDSTDVDFYKQKNEELRKNLDDCKSQLKQQQQLQKQDEAECKVVTPSSSSSSSSSNTRFNGTNKKPRTDAFLFGG